MDHCLENLVAMAITASTFPLHVLNAWRLDSALEKPAEPDVE